MMFISSYYLNVLRILFFWCCYNVVFSLDLNTKPKFDPQDTLTSPEMIRKAGYVCETHTVTTDDGFLLTLHRIVQKLYKSNSTNMKQKSFLLAHGLTGSSECWLLPEKSLAFLLTEKGHDVWLTNARGNKYSNRHTFLSTDDEKFWDFSWHEMGYYDLPAMIKYILKITDSKKINYIGYSMGTTQMMCLLTLKPEYSDMLQDVCFMAPVAYLHETKSPLRYLAPAGANMEKLMKSVGTGRLELNDEQRMTLTKACLDSPSATYMCEQLITNLCGPGSKQLDKNLTPKILGHMNAGTSWGTVWHYLQLVVNKQFCQYDHGKLKNLLIYKSITPPNYNLSKINIPLYISYANNDLLADEKDVKLLVENLVNSDVTMKEVDDPHFNHLDFLWGRDAKTCVYDPLIGYCERRKHRNTLSVFG